MSSSLSSSPDASSRHVRIASPHSDDPTPGSSNNEGPPVFQSILRSNHNKKSSLKAPKDGADDERSPLIDEQTALLQNGNQEDDSQTIRSFWYLLAMTISIGGLQIAWSVELSNGSPYLLSLGLSKSLMALVWIAGPLTGTLVQPYVGMMSDRCRVSWGKRKPFMLIGALATALSLMFLAYTTEIIGGLLSLFGLDPQSNHVKVSILVVAVAWVYILDFSINTVQAAIRAFIVDCAPPHQQESANAMASRITGVGNIFGYVAGYLDLTTYLWFLGNTQFKVLCALASILLCSTVLLSIVCIHERDPRLEGPAPKDQPGVLAFFKNIIASIKRLPPTIRKVCEVQLCAWVGFFPMLFYTSSFIGEIYVEPYLEENPNMTPEELDRLYETATRIGTFALLIFAITGLVTNIVLPFFIAPTYDTIPVDGSDDLGKGDDSDEKSPLDILVIPWLTLRRAWMISHILFAFSMFCTVLVRTVTAATVLIGLVGITWALTLWAPWAIISAEISRRDAQVRAKRQRAVSRSAGGADVEEEEVDQAGVILGIHNMAIAAPQMIATIGSSIIFRFFQKPRGTPGDHSFSVVLALGGIFVLGAAWIVHRIEDEPEPVDEVTEAEEGDRMPPQRPTFHSRKSVDRPRKSFHRAGLARSTSFGRGLEY